MNSNLQDAVICSTKALHLKNQIVCYNQTGRLNTVNEHSVLEFLTDSLGILAKCVQKMEAFILFGEYYLQT